MTKRLPSKADIQPDMFAANFADIPIRDQRDTMERPFFSLAKRKRLKGTSKNPASPTRLGWDSKVRSVATGLGDGSVGIF